MSPLGDEPTRSHPRMDWYGDEILCTVSRADYLASDGHPVVAHLMDRFVTTSSRIAALRDRFHEYPPVARNIPRLARALAPSFPTSRARSFGRPTCSRPHFDPLPVRSTRSCLRAELRSRVTSRLPAR
jgi:hypothetical protein